MSTTIALAHLGKGHIWHTLEAITGCDREMRLFAVWCARQVQHLMPDQRCTNTLDVAERYANGEASSEELDAARTAAAANAARTAAAHAVAHATAANAAADAAYAAANARYHANAAAYVAVRAAQTDELRRVVVCIDSGADPYPK